MSFSRIIKRKYDDRGNLIYSKDSMGFESWREYDENNRKIHWKHSDGSECWYKCDKNNHCTIIIEQEYKELKFRREEKEYNSRTKCSRFELMEI